MQQGGPKGPHLPLGPKARSFRWPWRPQREDTAASEDRAHRARGELAEAVHGLTGPAATPTAHLALPPGYLASGAVCGVGLAHP